MSGPVIENCNSVRFAPYHLQYPQLQQQLQSGGLPTTAAAEPTTATTTTTTTAATTSSPRDVWFDVKDFRWHRSQHSPHWCIIPITDRITNINSNHHVSLQQL